MKRDREKHVVIKKLNERGWVLAGHLPWVCLQLCSGRGCCWPQGEPLLPSGVTSSGFGHVLNQAGELVETTLLCSKERKSIWSREGETTRNRGVEDVVLEH